MYYPTTPRWFLENVYGHVLPSFTPGYPSIPNYLQFCQFELPYFPWEYGFFSKKGKITPLSGMKAGTDCGLKSYLHQYRSEWSRSGCAYPRWVYIDGDCMKSMGQISPEPFPVLLSWTFWNWKWTDRKQYLYWTSVHSYTVDYCNRSWVYTFYVKLLIYHMERATHPYN